MIIENGRKFIGLFEGTPYGKYKEQFGDYKRSDCKIDRESVLKHFESLDGAYTSEPTYDLFSGERFLAGLFDDGDYTITSDYIRYYKAGIVDIPKEYEEYLLNEFEMN